MHPVLTGYIPLFVKIFIICFYWSFQMILHLAMPVSALEHLPVCGWHFLNGLHRRKHGAALSGERAQPKGVTTEGHGVMAPGLQGEKTNACKKDLQLRNLFNLSVKKKNLPLHPSLAWLLLCSSGLGGCSVPISWPGRGPSPGGAAPAPAGSQAGIPGAGAGPAARTAGGEWFQLNYPSHSNSITLH